MLKPARVPSDDRRQFYAYIPYRCLLPRGLDGLLVVGLGLSAHRDAMPIIRMQPDLQNSGYAAGVAAAMAARRGQAPRQVDVRALQKRLVETGILAPEVLTHGDPPPVSPAVLDAAVAAVVGDGAGLEVLMTNAETALPRLRAAHDAAPGEQKLAYALVLGVMGDGHGTATLAAEARRRLDAADLAAGRGRDAVWTRSSDSSGPWGAAENVPPCRWICELAEHRGHGRHPVPRRGRLAGGLRRPRCRTDALEAPRGKAGSNAPAELMAACALLRCGDPEGNARQVLGRAHDSGPSAGAGHAGAAAGNGPTARCSMAGCAEAIVPSGSAWGPGVVDNDADSDDETDSDTPKRLRRARPGGAKIGGKGESPPLPPRSSPHCRKGSGGGRPLSGRPFARPTARPVPVAIPSTRGVTTMARTAGDRPNVVVFFTDQQRWDSTGVHGNPLDLTPNFDRMAVQGTHAYHAYTCHRCACRPGKPADRQIRQRNWLPYQRLLPRSRTS